MDTIQEAIIPKIGRLSGDNVNLTCLEAIIDPAQVIPAITVHINSRVFLLLSKKSEVKGKKKTGKAVISSRTVIRPRRCKTKFIFIHVILICMQKKLSIEQIGTGTTCSNRGIDHKNIFNDDSDYEKFIAIIGHYLVEYEPEEREGFKKEKKSLIDKKKQRNLAKDVSLLAYCLVPNAYEMLIIGPATKFIRRICTHYVMYFNKKYKRRGPLFVGRCQTKLVQFAKFDEEIKRIEQLPNNRVVRRFGPISATIMPIQRPKSAISSKLIQLMNDAKLALDSG